MPMKLADLDDLTYEDLLAEALTSIPAIYPAWTDHNPSNPGITLIEMFAWLTDTMVYRTNLITETNQWAFVKLLRGPGWTNDEGLDIETALRDAVGELREQYRAVTEQDYEMLATKIWSTTPDAAATEGIARVHCLAEKSVNESDALVDAPGYVTLLVVPNSPRFYQSPPANWVDPSEELKKSLLDFFADRKLLTTRLRVRGPHAISLSITATIYLKDDARRGIRDDINSALCRHFHPTFGGFDGRGWPLGRSVYPSDVYALLEEVAGIDYAESVAVKAQGASGAKRKLDENGEIGVKLFDHELAKLDNAGIVVTLMERRGDKWVTMNA